MIVRILGEGQFDVSVSSVEQLNAIDEEVVAAVESGDEATFARNLEKLVDGVKAHGSRLPDDYLGPSDLVLPSVDSSLEEVRLLLGEEGLLPG